MFFFCFLCHTSSYRFLFIYTQSLLQAAGFAKHSSYILVKVDVLIYLTRPTMACFCQKGNVSSFSYFSISCLIIHYDQFSDKARFLKTYFSYMGQLHYQNYKDRNTGVSKLHQQCLTVDLENKINPMLVYFFLGTFVLTTIFTNLFGKWLLHVKGALII